MRRSVLHRPQIASAVVCPQREMEKGKEAREMERERERESERARERERRIRNEAFHCASFVHARSPANSALESTVVYDG